MTPFVIGTREDVAGFALAGVDGAICNTDDEANRALMELRRDQIAIVSAEFANCAAIARAPMHVILPPR